MPLFLDTSCFLKLFIGSTSGFCRTLDRLHLAAMEDLQVRRLLTNDAIQAEAANELGFQVILPQSES